MEYPFKDATQHYHLGDSKEQEGVTVSDKESINSLDLHVPWIGKIAEVRKSEGV